MLRPGDRFRLLTIGLSVYISIPWREAGESFELNMAPVAGISLIRDAVVAALLHPVSPGRRHLIVALTDGYDCGSLIEPNLVGDIAARSEAVLHWVAVERPGAVRPTGTFAWCPMNASYFDTGPLKEAVERSGGDLHRGGFRRADAVAAFSKVFEEFRQSYILHYSPEGVPGTGWHELRVEVPAGRYTVRARPGYFGR
jgi:hypothetical protein